MRKILLILALLAAFGGGRFYQYRTSTAKWTKCFKSTFHTFAKPETIAEYFGLPKEYNDPSLNATVAYYDTQMAACMAGGK
jgi:hypothetical protein